MIFIKIIESLKMISKTDLAALTFKEFRERFSTGEGFLGRRIKTQMPLYFAPNEEPISGGFRAVGSLLSWVSAHSQNPRVGFYGIVGGVDLTLSYVAAVKPDIAVLTDINDTAIDYLDSRLNIFRGADAVEQYFNILGKENPRALKKIQAYTKRLSVEDRGKLWFSDKDGFNLLKRMVEGEKIKAFQSDYYRKGQEVIAGLIEEFRPDAAVFYLSDIAAVAGNRESVKGEYTGNMVVVQKLSERKTPFIIMENAIGKGNYVSIRHVVYTTAV